MPFRLSTVSSGKRRKVGFLHHMAWVGSHIFIDWGRFIPWLLQVTSVRKTTDPYSLKASPSPHPDGFFLWHSNHSSGLLLGSTGSGCCILRTSLTYKTSGRGERPLGLPCILWTNTQDQGTPGGSIHVGTVTSLLIALLPQEIHSTFGQRNNSVVFIEIYIW